MSSFGGQRGEKLKLEGVFAEGPSCWRRFLGLALKDCKAGKSVILGVRGVEEARQGQGNEEGS